MDRERITISIKKNVLKLIDEIIDGINIRNRSHAIEHLILKGLARSESKNAVILLGGKDALKHLQLAETTLKKLAQLGYARVFIAVGYLADKIENKLGDGKKFGLKIKYLRDGEGSGGSLLALKKEFNSSFLVFNIKESIDLDFEHLMNYHQKHHATATAIIENNKKTGVYVLEPKIFNYIPKGFSMFEEEILPKLQKDNEVIGYLHF